jgi:dethiobiotin synthetase
VASDEPVMKPEHAQTASTTRGLYVTGTDTGVGKTLVAVALLRALNDSGMRARGLKPLASGAMRTPDGLRNADALALQSAGRPAAPYALVNPYCFEPAIAPHLAAAEAGVAMPLADLLRWYQAASAGCDCTIVEGAGGWRVPLHPGGFTSDLPEALAMPVVLVVGLRLGCLNHARLTYEAIRAGGHCRFAGWIGNRIDPDFERLTENLATLSRLLERAPLAVLPTMDPPDIASVAALLAHDGVDRLL